MNPSFGTSSNVGDAAPTELANPAQLRTSAAEPMRVVRLRTYMAIVGALFATSAVVHVLYGHNRDAITLACAGVCAVAVIGLRRARDRQITLHLVLLVLFIAEMIMMDRHRDTSYIGVAWLLTLPVLAGLLGMSRHILIWTPAVIASLVFASWRAGPDNQMWNESMTLSKLVSVTVLLSVAGYAMLYIRLQREAALRSALEEARALAAEREEAMTQARSAENARRRFLAAMSHELRTPMAGVVLAADALSTEHLTPGQREMATAIRTSADSLIGVLNEVLDLAKIDSGQIVIRPIEFDVIGLVQEVAALMSRQADLAGLTLVTDLPPTMPQWWVGDPARLRQVLLNLTSNALRNTQQGSVRICAGVTGGGELQLSVDDTGVGIAPTELAELLDPMLDSPTIGQSASPGTGLGLMISRDLVDAMGGTLTANSVEGRGSSFAVTIPGQSDRSAPIGESLDPPDAQGTEFSIVSRSSWAVEAATTWLDYWGARIGAAGHPLHIDERLQGSRPSERIATLARLVDRTVRPRDDDTDAVGANPLAAAPPNGYRCLVVDDDLIAQQVLGAVMQSLGYDAAVAGGGPEALDMLASDHFDFMLLDLSMPGMTGLEVLAHVRQLPTDTACIPVCIVSGTVLDRHELIAAGADEFLLKPSRATELAIVAERLIDLQRSTLHRSPPPGS